MRPPLKVPSSLPILPINNEALRPKGGSVMRSLALALILMLVVTGLAVTGSQAQPLPAAASTAFNQCYGGMGQCEVVLPHAGEGDLLAGVQPEFWAEIARAAWGVAREVLREAALHAAREFVREVVRQVANRLGSDDFARTSPVVLATLFDPAD